MGDKPLSSEYIPFAADHRRGDRLGRRPSRPVGCHAQVIQLPSDALLPELGQASLAVTLERFPLARAVCSQAPAFNAGVLDEPSSLYYYTSIRLAFHKFIQHGLHAGRPFTLRQPPVHLHPPIAPGVL